MLTSVFVMKSYVSGPYHVSAVNFITVRGFPRPGFIGFSVSTDAAADPVCMKMRGSTRLISVVLVMLRGHVYEFVDVTL